MKDKRVDDLIEDNKRLNQEIIWLKNRYKNLEKKQTGLAEVIKKIIEGTEAGFNMHDEALQVIAKYIEKK